MLSSRICNLSELVSLRYGSVCDDIDKHIENTAVLIEKIIAMGISLDDALAIDILVTSISVPKFMPVIAALKKLTKESIK